MNVTVYSKPDCVKCTATYKALDKTGVNYTVIDITEDADAMAYAVGLGHVAAPVVVVNRPDGSTEHWSDFRRERIQALV